MRHIKIVLVIAILFFMVGEGCGTNNAATGEGQRSASDIPTQTRNQYKISIAKLILLNKDTKDNIETFLRSKHFDHTTTKSANGNNCTIWGFLYGDEKSSDPVSARVEYCVSPQGVFDGLTYWIIEDKYYYECLNEIDKMGFKLFKENINSKGEIAKIFTDEPTKTVLIVGSEKVKNGQAELTGYSFSIMNWDTFQNLLQQK